MLIFIELRRAQKGGVFIFILLILIELRLIELRQAQERGGIYIYFISVLCTITAESSTTDLATTHLTSLARDIFWSQKSQLYIVNSYSWEFFFRLANIFQTR